MSYLRVCQAEHGSQLLSVRFGDVFLDLKSLLQALSLQVREDGPGPRPFPLVRLRHRVLGQDCVRPWKTQGGGGGEKKEEQKAGSSFSCHQAALFQPPVCSSPLQPVSTWEGVLKLMLACLPATAAAAGAAAA